MKHIQSFADFLNEGTTNWSVLIKAAKSGKSPYALVVVDKSKEKVLKQEINIENFEAIPAHYEALRKDFPNALIHLEDSEGKRLWSK